MKILFGGVSFICKDVYPILRLHMWKEKNIYRYNCLFLCGRKMGIVEWNRGWDNSSSISFSTALSVSLPSSCHAFERANRWDCPHPQDVRISRRCRSQENVVYAKAENSVAGTDIWYRTFTSSCGIRLSKEPIVKHWRIRKPTPTSSLPPSPSQWTLTEPFLRIRQEQSFKLKKRCPMPPLQPIYHAR